MMTTVESITFISKRNGRVAMKSIFVWLGMVFLGIFFHVGNVAAISAISDIVVDKAVSSGSEIQAEVSSTIYLLDWKDNKLYTSKGVFVTDGIQVVNHSGIAKERIAKSNPPPIVELVKKEGLVSEIIIQKTKEQ